MNTREQFAKSAMESYIMLAGGSGWEHEKDKIARLAFEMADEMMKHCEKPEKNTRPKTVDPDFLETLKANPAYNLIDVSRELGKMQAWCATNHRVPTKRLFVAWLNRTSDGIISRKPYKPGPEETFKQRIARKARAAEQETEERQIERERQAEVQRQKVHILAQEFKRNL